jgi:hypothetical protein
MILTKKKIVEKERSSRSEANYGSRPSLNGLKGAQMTAIIGRTFFIFYVL